MKKILGLLLVINLVFFGYTVQCSQAKDLGVIKGFEVVEGATKPDSSERMSSAEQNFRLSYIAQKYKDKEKLINQYIKNMNEEKGKKLYQELANRAKECGSEQLAKYYEGQSEKFDMVSWRKNLESDLKALEKNFDKYMSEEYGKQQAEQYEKLAMEQNNRGGSGANGDSRGGSGANGDDENGNNNTPNNTPDPISPKMQQVLNGWF